MFDVDTLVDEYDMDDDDSGREARKLHKTIVKSRIQRVARFVRKPKSDKKEKVQRGGVREEPFAE